MYSFMIRRRAHHYFEQKFIEYPHLCLICWKEKVDGEWDDNFCKDCERKYVGSEAVHNMSLSEYYFEYFDFYMKNKEVVNELMLSTGCTQYQCCYELIASNKCVDKAIELCMKHYNHK